MKIYSIDVEFYKKLIVLLRFLKEYKDDECEYKFKINYTSINSNCLDIYYDKNLVPELFKSITKTFVLRTNNGYVKLKTPFTSIHPGDRRKVSEGVFVEYPVENEVLHVYIGYDDGYLYAYGKPDGSIIVVDRRNRTKLKLYEGECQLHEGKRICH